MFGRPAWKLLILVWLVTTNLLGTLPAQETLVANSASLAEVQAVFRRHCIRCHGQKNREAGLRLDMPGGVLHSEEPVVAPGKPEESILMHRVLDPNYGDLMPLDSEPLSKAELSVLRNWIASGARWPVSRDGSDSLRDEGSASRHWAYRPLQRPAVPAQASPASESSSTNAIDYFVTRQLDANGLALQPCLDRGRLLRRLSLALIGLPPSPEEVQLFVQDTGPNATERAVDRLLQSQAFGERWAVPWLDLARYADSNGFQADQIRDNWAFRDWVIRALNEDMPYDRFAIEQLAGDLLPGATVDQRIATGFHRMTTCNVEAGVDPEANRVNQIVDRVNTTATVFMGTTLECAQCHDHKYDPFTQVDYYRLFAYFNNTPLEVENTSGVTWDFYGPTLDLPLDSAKRRERQRIQEQVVKAKRRLEEHRSESESEFRSWVTSLSTESAKREIWEPQIPVSFESSDGGSFEVQADGAVLLTGSVPDKAEYRFVFNVSRFTSEAPPTAIRLETLTDSSIAEAGPGRGDRPNMILNEIRAWLSIGDQRKRLEWQRAFADFSQTKWDVAGAIDGKPKTGWAISPEFRKPHWAAFVLNDERTVFCAWKRKAQRLNQPLTLEIELVQHYGRGRVIGKPRISLTSANRRFLGIEDSIRELAAQSNLDEKQESRLRNAFERNDSELVALTSRIETLKTKLASIAPDTTLVMIEDEPRQTFVMMRGDYESPGESVQPMVPELFPFSDEIPRTGDRLELARWLVSRDNPLAARVAVNRWWAALFGVGLVGTPEDFGTQSELPSHPELLDWLASELVESGWSMKHVLKTIVLSRTFQQKAAASSSLFARDPENRLLARGPRFRLPAEIIRDNALAISGLLSQEMYGPPIMPYQPDLVWRSVGRNQPKWISAEDQNRFRRGVYVVCKRAAPYPSFINFDAPKRSSCTVHRNRTNTPLQALTLLNDPAYAEMALAFADRVLSQCPQESDASRIEFAFEIALSRKPSGQETQVLKRLVEQERLHLTEEQVQKRTRTPFPAMRLCITDRRELAVWLLVANAILNLDETMNP